MLLLPRSREYHPKNDQMHLHSMAAATTDPIDKFTTAFIHNPIQKIKKKDYATLPNFFNDSTIKILQDIEDISMIEQNSPPMSLKNPTPTDSLITCLCEPKCNC